MSSAEQTGLHQRNVNEKDFDGQPQYDHEEYQPQYDQEEYQPQYDQEEYQPQGYQVQHSYAPLYVKTQEVGPIEYIELGPFDYIDRHGRVRRKTGAVYLACCLALCWCCTWPCHGPCLGGW